MQKTRLHRQCRRAKQLWVLITSSTRLALIYTPFSFKSMPSASNKTSASTWPDSFPDPDSPEFLLLYKRLLSYATRLGTSPEEAADLVQESLLRVISEQRHFPTKLPPFPGLAWTVRSLCFHRAKARRAFKRGPEELSLDQILQAFPSWGPSSPEASPESLLLAKERREQLAEAIARLPPRMRRALLLRLDGYTYRDIAVALKLPVDAVKNTLFRARRSIARGIYE